MDEPVIDQAPCPNIPSYQIQRVDKRGEGGEDVMR
jgi:hypothetical protein